MKITSSGIVAVVQWLQDMHINKHFHHLTPSPLMPENPPIHSERLNNTGSAKTILLNILQDAIRLGCSDIHLEPTEQGYRIRLRIDGILRPYFIANRALANSLINITKIESELDISEKKRTQDGHITLNIDNQDHCNIRVSTQNTYLGEKIVYRLLPGQSTLKSIQDLGMSPIQQAMFTTALHKKNGLILTIGPTGSGKTATLYAGLNALNTPKINIVTIENPIEIPLPYVNQININEKKGITFASALRSVLRQDPDVIMVGEIRDKQTADLVMDAAYTGHLVLSSIHSSTFPQSLIRLKRLGIPTDQVLECANLIITQRLVRTLCHHCNGSDSGCLHCHCGYAGRTGRFELIDAFHSSGDHAALAHPNNSHLEPSACTMVEKNKTSVTEREQSLWQ